MIEIRAGRAGDEPALAALFEASFGYRPHGEYWSWKYQRIPGRARSLVAVAAGGEIVAHVGALALPARSAGETKDLWQLVDFMGSAAGSGLRPPLVAAGRALLEDLPEPADFPWIFGFPSERHFALGVRQFGYRPLREVRPLAGPLPAAAGPAGSLLEISDHCGEWAEPVWSACAVSSVRRSAAFLNWRYHARPDRYYRFYRLRSEAEEGLAVFGFHREQAMAAELWLPPGPDWTGAMLSVARDLAGMGVESWTFWPRPLAAPLFHALGVSEREEIVRIGCRGRAGGPDPVAAAAGFEYSMGDYDLT